jgi:vacuolar-type H+-ATPase subunit D/Vma8
MAVTVELNDRASRAEQIVTSGLARESSACDGEDNMKKRINQLQTMVELLKGEKEVLTKRLSDSEKEFKELSGRACVDAEKMEAQLQSQSEQIAKLNAGRGDLSRLSDSIKSLEQRVTTLKEERDEFKVMIMHYISKSFISFSLVKTKKK